MSALPRAGRMVTALTALAALGACANQADPQGTPTAQPESPSQERSSAAGAAPPVADPLDATPLVSRPCSALSAADRDRLGFDEGRQESTSGVHDAVACVWHEAEDSGNRVDLAVVTENATGLDAIYEQADRNDYFEPTEIAGYPAVHTATIDDRSDGGCGLWVGVDERVTLFVITNFDNGPRVADPCPVADEVAAAAIATLGG